MTNTARPSDSHGDSAPRSCVDVSSQLRDYVAGSLSDGDARAIEWHAAHCTTCESLLLGGDHELLAIRDAATVLGQHIPLDGREADQLRRATLERVHGVPRAPRVQDVPFTRGARGERAAAPRLPQWFVPAGTLLAASLLLLLARRSTGDRTPTAANINGAGSDSAWMAFPGATSAPMRSALQLAREQAAPEFEALDTARKEIDLALAAAPNDNALREFRDAIDARRRELETRVARVTE